MVISTVSYLYNGNDGLITTAPVATGAERGEGGGVTARHLWSTGRTRIKFSYPLADFGSF